MSPSLTSRKSNEVQTHTAINSKVVSYLPNVSLHRKYTKHKLAKGLLILRVLCFDKHVSLCFFSNFCSMKPSPPTGAPTAPSQGAVPSLFRDIGRLRRGVWIIRAEGRGSTQCRNLWVREGFEGIFLREFKHLFSYSLLVLLCQSDIIRFLRWSFVMS